MRFALIAALFAFASSAIAQQTDADALKLLDQVAKHYEEAESVHIEATVNETSHNDLYDSTATAKFSSYTASGGRFRYDGTSWPGSGLIVSDGTNEWRLMRSFAEYAKAPPGTFFTSRNAISGDNGAIYEAHNLLPGLISFASGIRSAHFAPNEEVKVGERTVHCVVVHFGSDDMVRSLPQYQFETTYWIDPKSLTVLKERRESQSPLSYGNKIPPHGSVLEHVTTMIFTTVEFNFEPQVDTFTFAPPRDSKEVAELPQEMPKPANVPAEPSPAAKIAAEHLGKQLPEIVVHDAAWNEVKLSRYAGHPLLLDLWATWCGPCVSELPALDMIRKSIAQTDLKIIGIDEDSKLDVAPALLKRRDYDWEDFHFTLAVTKALPTTGIPLIVLVDSSGKIVYYHTGADDVRGLATAIAELGKPYEVVSAEK